MTWAEQAVLVALLGAGVVTDLRRGMIYNWLTLPAAGLGVFLGCWQAGWWGLWTALAGVLVGGGLLLLPFMMGALGGGDVKLLAAVGALAGPAFALKVAVYACLVGGLWALLVMLAKGRLLEGMANLGRLLRGLLVPGLRPAPPQSLGLPGIPFAVCLAAGALWARFFDLLPGWFRA
jgi:prepilin peptidase CpaA